jgi:hypothetical protein
MRFREGSPEWSGSRAPAAVPGLTCVDRARGARRYLDVADRKPTGDEARQKAFVRSVRIQGSFIGRIIVDIYGVATTQPVKHRSAPQYRPKAVDTSSRISPKRVSAAGTIDHPGRRNAVAR